MKRITILAVLAFAATAVAATDGTYIQGNSTGATKKGAGVSMTVSNGTFAINVIRYRETCRYGSRTIHDFITFKSGSRAHLTGPVDATTGAFKGKYVYNSGTVKVSGTISGTTATIKSTEFGPYNFASTTHPNSCKGSHTFNASLPTG